MPPPCFQWVYIAIDQTFIPKMNYTIIVLVFQNKAIWCIVLLRCTDCDAPNKFILTLHFCSSSTIDQMLLLILSLLPTRCVLVLSFSMLLYSFVIINFLSLIGFIFLSSTYTLESTNKFCITLICVEHTALIVRFMTPLRPICRLIYG